MALPTGGVTGLTRTETFASTALNRRSPMSIMTGAYAGVALLIAGVFVIVAGLVWLAEHSPVDIGTRTEQSRDS